MKVVPSPAARASGGPVVDSALVLHIAKLACLSLSAGEVNRFAVELGRILAYVEQLEQIDTRDVPPTAHVRLDRTPWRDDEVRPGLTHEDALRQAPHVESDGFAVPPFLE